MTPTDLQVEPPIGPWEQPTKAPVYSVLNKQVNGSLVVNASNLNASEAGVRDEALARVEVAVLATVFILAVVGNVCVLVALGRKRITSRMHMFIMHLSIADLLVAFCNVLPQLAWDIVGTFHGGDVLCRTVKFLQVFVMYLSTYVLVMTAIDRYRAICYPLSNYHRSSNTVRIMITVAYVLSGVFSIPQPILFKYDTETSNCLSDFGDSPWLLHAYVISFTAAVYIIPFLILAFAYGSICYTIWANQPISSSEEGRRTNSVETTSSPDRNGVQLHSGEGHSSKFAGNSSVVSSPVLKRWHFSNYNSCGSQNGRNGVMRPRVHSMRGYSRAKLKTVKVTFVVIVAYLFCWSPFFVSQLWWLFDPSQGNNKAVVIMILLGSLNSCCNPWIYLAFSGNLIRQLLPRAWLCSSCCGSAPTPSNRHLEHIPHTPSASKQRLEMQLLCKKAKDRDHAKGSGAGGHPHKLIGTSMSLLTMRNLGTTRTKTSPTELGAARANILELVRHNDSDDDALEAEVPASVSDGPSALGNVSFCQTPWADNTESCGDGGAGHRTHNGGHVSVTDANADGVSYSRKPSSPRKATWKGSNSTHNGGHLSASDPSADGVDYSRKPSPPREASSKGSSGTCNGGPNKACANGVNDSKTTFLSREASSKGSNCSSSSRNHHSSKPPSPHATKRARLHERPPEEVVEAQMKWEHNMGLKPSTSFGNGSLCGRRSDRDAERV